MNKDNEKPQMQSQEEIRLVSYINPEEQAAVTARWNHLVKNTKQEYGIDLEEDVPTPKLDDDDKIRLVSKIDPQRP